MRWHHVLVCFGLLAMLAGPAVAVAQGGGSAGDQQYTDPFGGGAPKTHKTHTTTTQTQTATQAPTTTSSTSPPAVTPTTAPAVTDPGGSATATAAGNGKTLPYTGLDLWTVAGLGVTLTVSGLLIRTRSRRA